MRDPYIDRKEQRDAPVCVQTSITLCCSQPPCASSVFARILEITTDKDAFDRIVNYRFWFIIGCGMCASWGWGNFNFLLLLIFMLARIHRQYMLTGKKKKRSKTMVHGSYQFESVHTAVLLNAFEWTHAQNKSKEIGSLLMPVREREIPEQSCLQ